MTRDEFMDYLEKKVDEARKEMSEAYTTGKKKEEVKFLDGYFTALHGLLVELEVRKIMEEKEKI